MVTTTADDPILVVRGAQKSFGATQALRGVDFEVRRGENHALLGENGAGKSTLIKILAGLYPPDAGIIELAGEPLTDANRTRIAFIHQDLGLIPDLSVADNFAIVAGYPTRYRVISWPRTRARATSNLRSLGVDIPADALVRDLGPGDRSLVAIARALYRRCDVLVLDEPTATLVARDVERLFGALRALRDQGVGIIYVSHRLGEVRSLAGVVTVLRDGSVVASRLAGASEAELTRFIVGHDLAADTNGQTTTSVGESVIRVTDFGTEGVAGLSFEVGRGEVLGITGLRGSGHEQIGRALFGLQPWSGTSELDGRPFHAHDPGEALSRRTAYVVGDRSRNGISSLSILDNLFVGHWASGSHAFLRQPRREVSEARRIVTSFDIRPPDPQRALSELSGGNWQKVALARSLELHPSLLIMDDPTAGVDVGARAEIYRIIRGYAERGTGVLLVSSDYEEIALHAHRVLVMNRGRLRRTLTGDKISPSRINSAATEAV